MEVVVCRHDRSKQNKSFKGLSIACYCEIMPKRPGRCAVFWKFWHCPLGYVLDGKDILMPEETVENPGDPRPTVSNWTKPVTPAPPKKKVRF